MGKILRRTFLIGSAAVAGGVAIGYWQVSKPYANPLDDQLDDGQTALTPYVIIDQQGVAIITPRAEMGQGVHTTLAALVAEELDVALEDVTVSHGPTSKAYYASAVFEEGVPFAATDNSANAQRMRSIMRVAGKVLGMQMTGGSSSIPDGYDKMRKAGAAARAVLIAAAAKKLNVAEDALNTERGAVIGPNGVRLPYTELAVLAADIKPPSNPPLKSPAAWKILGKSTPRVDMVAKSTGTANYAMDVRLPGMKFAAIKMNPRLEAPMISFDASKAETMPGVERIIEIENGVAVVASNTWAAFRATDAIDFNWGEASYPANTSDHFEALAAAFTDDRQDSQLKNEGDVEATLAALGDNIIEAEYRAPYLAHATMEPVGATALLKDGKLEVWAGSQIPTQARKDAASIVGLREKDVTVHTLYLGGGFGRRLEMDFIKLAVHVAKAMEGTPVKVTWSREEDMRHDAYRPAAMARVRAAVKDGKPTAFDLKLSTTSIMESQFGRLGMSMPGPDLTIVQSTWDQPYGIEHHRVTGYKAPLMPPISSWRSVGASQNAFFHESALDEIAAAAGSDPLAMRLDLMTDEPSRAVIETVRDMANWNEPMPRGKARGMAFCLSFGVPTAEVVEIEQTANGVKVVKVYAAVDVGTALDPGLVEAQVQSAVIFGLSAAISGEITFRDGEVEQSNFHDYDAVRMYQSPPIEVAILENGDKIRGIGEPGLPPVAPALANALFSLTGERIRELPLSKRIQFI